MKKITHGSTFSGIGAPEIAAEMLGWKNAFHCEINDFGRKVLDYHFQESESYEDITKQDFSKWRGKITVLTGGFPCFAAGTPVLTDKGFLPIQDVRAGMNVLTKDGRYHEVQCVMSHDAQEIVEMRAQGMWKNLETTPNHRFFVMRKKNIRRRNEYEAPEWIEIGNCKKGDRIAYPVHDGNNMSHDNAFWKLIGLWLADGWTCTSKRKDRINSYNHKTIICCGHGNVERMKNTIEAAGFNYTLSKNKTKYNAIICDKELSDFLSGFGKYAHGKHLAPECFTLDRERKKSLLEGWFADGYKNRNGSVKITTVSELLALDMAQIARDAYNCPISISRKTTRRKCIIEGREVNERPQYCVTISNSMRCGEYENGLLWCDIKNIEKKKKEIKVYNLSVNEEQSYTVYGIAVHNCQPFSYAGKRRGTEDDRYLWPYMLKCIDQIRPTWFVGENVAGITTMVFPGKDAKVGEDSTLFGTSDRMERRERYVIEEICQQLEDIGYSVQPMLIPACAVGAPHRRDRVFFIAHRNDDADTQRNDTDTECSLLQQRNGSTEEGRRQSGERTESLGCNKPREVRTNVYPNPSCSGSGAQEPCGATEINGSDGYAQPSQRTDGLSAVQGTDTHTDSTRQPTPECESGRERQTMDGRSERQPLNGAGRPCTSFNVADPRCTELQAGLDERGDIREDGETSGGGGRGNRIDDEGTRTDADTENLQRNGCRTGERYDVGARSTEFGDNRKSAVGDIEILYPNNRWRTFPTVSPVYRGNDGLPFDVDHLTIPFSRWKKESLKAYGNAIVVQVMYEIFRAIDEIENRQ